MNKRHPCKSVLKYGLLTLFGLLLFLLVYKPMSLARGHGSPGGELALLLLPVLWWLIARIGKDWAADVLEEAAATSQARNDATDHKNA